MRLTYQVFLNRRRVERVLQEQGPCFFPEGSWNLNFLFGSKNDRIFEWSNKTTWENSLGFTSWVTAAPLQLLLPLQCCLQKALVPEWQVEKLDTFLVPSLFLEDCPLTHWNISPNFFFFLLRAGWWGVSGALGCNGVYHQCTERVSSP